MGQGYYIGTLRLPQGLADDARSLAKAKSLSLARLVQESVREYIQNHGGPRVLILRNGTMSVVTVLRDKGDPGAVDQFFLPHDATEAAVREAVFDRLGVQPLMIEELT